MPRCRLDQVFGRPSALTGSSSPDSLPDLGLLVGRQESPGGPPFLSTDASDWSIVIIWANRIVTAPWASFASDPAARLRQVSVWRRSGSDLRKVQVSMDACLWMLAMPLVRAGRHNFRDATEPP